MNNEKIRVSKEFKEIIDYIRGKSLLCKGKCPSTTLITKIIAKKLDKYSLYENEFNR